MKYITNENIEPSFAEHKIIQMLRKANVRFVREVSFLELTNPETGALLRYDFYIPEYNMLIEYDGVKSHSSNDAKYRDSLKNDFADMHKIKLIRISGLRFIDVFFKSDIWTKQVKKATIHRLSKSKVITAGKDSVQIAVERKYEYFANKNRQLKQRRAAAKIADAIVKPVKTQAEIKAILSKSNNLLR